MTTSEHIKDISDPRPEPGKRHDARRQEMNIRQKHLAYGGIRVNGMKPARAVCETCENFADWCTCETV